MTSKRHPTCGSTTFAMPHFTATVQTPLAFPGTWCPRPPLLSKPMSDITGAQAAAITQLRQKLLVIDAPVSSIRVVDNDSLEVLFNDDTSSRQRYRYNVTVDEKGRVVDVDTWEADA